MSLNRSGEPRFGIHSIDHFALEVPSLSEAEAFFSAFGLIATRESNRISLRTANDLRPWGYCYEGTVKRLAYLSFACFEEEYLPLVQQVRGIPETQSAPGGPYVNAEGTWFHDVDGNLYQVRPGPKRTLMEPAAGTSSPRPPGSRGTSARSLAPRVRPNRLSHVMLFTPDVGRAVRYYGQALGLRMSDWSQDIVAFTHGRHGSDHHLLAFVKSSARGWHHSSWDVASVDEVGLGAEQMRRAGYIEGWGTARHVLGSNYFHYVRDPWGSFAEFSADIDFIPAGTEWSSMEYEPEDSLYLWGPEVPPYFVLNTEAPSAPAP
ncbi:MAG: VOC family protein [Panacagrimonas sp.]